MELLLVKIAYCRPLTLLKKVSVTDYRFLTLKAVPKDYCCLQKLERLSQGTYWQFFLKLFLWVTKVTGKNNIWTNANQSSNKQTIPKHYIYLSCYNQLLSWTGQHSKCRAYLLALFKERQRKRQITTWLITIGCIKGPHEQQSVKDHLSKSKIVNIIYAWR